MPVTPDSTPLKALVQKITDLPTLPSMMATITRLMQDPRTSAEELGRAIATDPALVSKVLKLVNSAFYGFPGRISTITQAIVILGFSTIRNVVLTTSVLKVFGDSKSKGFDMEVFWEHSLLTGAISRSLAHEHDLPFTEETFIAGLLHDMGRMILSQRLTSEFEKVVAFRDKTGMSMLEAEKTILGLTHGEIGGWLARKWNLPIPFVEVMHYHHFPMQAPIGDARQQMDTGHLIPLVHIADVLAKGVKDDLPTRESIPAIHPQVWQRMGMEGETWDRFQRRTRDEIEKARAFLEIL
ncbi:MAG TPA: HDOD domain-containing protein [Fibrobacteria bacterium]|nr:HDOD domain-containing protein [Fibrobacteria bacterium]